MTDHTHDPCFDCFSRCYDSSIEDWDNTKLPCGCGARDLYIARLERRVDELMRHNLVRSVEPIIYVRWDSVNTDTLKDFLDNIGYIKFNGHEYVVVSNVKLLIDQLPKEVSDLGFDYFVGEDIEKKDDRVL